MTIAEKILSTKSGKGTVTPGEIVEAYPDLVMSHTATWRSASVMQRIGATKLYDVDRLAIVLELTRGPKCVHELVDVLGISQSLASQHLRVLRSAGLVSGAHRGKETSYRLTDDHVAHIARDAVTHGSEPGRRTPRLDTATTEEDQS